MSAQIDALRFTHDWCVSALRGVYQLSSSINRLRFDPDDEAGLEAASDVVVQYRALHRHLAAPGRIWFNDPVLSIAFREPCIFGTIERSTYHAIAWQIADDMARSLQQLFDQILTNLDLRDGLKVAGNERTLGLAAESASHENDIYVHHTTFAQREQFETIRIWTLQDCVALTSRLRKEYLIALHLIDPVGFLKRDTEPEGTEVRLPMTLSEKQIWMTLTSTPQSNGEVAKQIGKSLDMVRQAIRSLRQKGYDIRSGNGGYFRPSKTESR